MRLFPVQALTDASRDANAADTNTFSEVAKPEMALIINDFTEAADLVVGDLVLGAADGLDPKKAATVPPWTYQDPTDGARIIQNRDPAGGWLWTYTGSTPVTIYGVAMTSDGGADLWAVKKLDDTTDPPGPVNLLGVGDAFVLGSSQVAFPLGTV